MWNCGIDVSSKKSYVVVSDEKGALSLSKEIDTSKVAFHTALQPYAKQELRIVIEAGGETLWIYDCLKELGAEVVVVNPLRVEKRRGKKTALIALTRKILTVAFSMLRTGTIYDPKICRTQRNP